MEQVLLVVQVIIAICLIGMVLIQRSDSDGFGLSGGSGNNLLSGRSSANLMTRTTAIFAALFLMNSLALGVIAARSHTSSIVDTIEQQQSSVPAVPVAGETKADKKAPAKADVKPEKKAADAKPAVPVDGAAPVAEPVKKPAKKAAAKTDDAPANENE